MSLYPLFEVRTADGGLIGTYRAKDAKAAVTLVRNERLDMARRKYGAVRYPEGTFDNLCAEEIAPLADPTA
jgi:hypothetical protein